MNKIKITFICLLIPFLVFIVFVLSKIKAKEDYRQKAALAREIRKVMLPLMFDLRDARENTILDVPADGLWHDRIAFDNTTQGALEYLINEGHLWRINNKKPALLADNIGALHIRRQKQTPDILEVQIEAKNSITLTSNLKIRIRQ